MQTSKDAKIHLSLLTFFIIIFIWSAINPHDYFTWFLEVFPAVIVIIALIFTYNKFRFSNLVYLLVFIHAAILLIGGHYTYAEVPLFNWIKDYFELARNHYDRLGHFAQGVIPVILLREILIRKNVVKNKKWLFFILIAIVMFISASYELLEFGVAKTTGSAADAFLGTQGDVFDTDWDMFFALIGGLTALLTISKIHDKSIEKLKS